MLRSNHKHLHPKPATSAPAPTAKPVVKPAATSAPKAHAPGFEDAKKVVCPVCGATGSKNAMKRWHFDKCKMRV